MNSRDEDDPRCNILVAYPYCKPNILAALNRHRGSVRFLLDSGAFTAFMAGKSIKLSDYEGFVKSLQDAGLDLWRYFTLDVIGNPVETRRNYDTLLARGLKPVPIFTRGESLKTLDEYYETSDVVAIGGLVGTNDPAGFVNGVMKHIGKRRVHLLGFTRIEFLKHYRPYMCDSSSFAQTCRYGTLSIYKGNAQWCLAIKKETFRERPSREVCRVLQEYDIDPQELAKQAAWCGIKGLATRLSSSSWARWQVDVMRHLGVRLFFAVIMEEQIDQLVNGHDYWRARSCSGN